MMILLSKIRSCIHESVWVLLRMCILYGLAFHSLSLEYFHDSSHPVVPCQFLPLIVFSVSHPSSLIPPFSPVWRPCVFSMEGVGGGGAPW